MTIELTNEQIDLLQNILIYMIENKDWVPNSDQSFLEANVIMDFDESLPNKVLDIYNQLFV